MAIADRAYSIIVVLAITDSFRVLSLISGASVSNLTVVLAVFTLAYAFLNSKSFFNIVRRKEVVYFSILFLIWPLATVLYAEKVAAREVLFVVYFYLFTLSIYVLANRNGAAYLLRIVIWALAVTVVGLILGYLVPDVFAAMAELADAQTGVYGRASGFFLQPNVAGRSLVAFFVLAVIFMYQVAKQPAVLFVSAIVTLSVVLTGSRTAFVLLLLAFVAVVLLNRDSRERARLAQKIGGALVILGLLVTSVLLDFVQLHMPGGEALIGRTSESLGLAAGRAGPITEDESILRRIEAQAAYLALLSHRPLLGYGLGSDARFLEDGRLVRSAHSTALSVSLDYGLLYPIVVTALSLSLLRRSRGVRMWRHAKFNPAALVLLILVPWFYFNGGLFGSRAFYFLVGSLLWLRTVQSYRP